MKTCYDTFQHQDEDIVSTIANRTSMTLWLQAWMNFGKSFEDRVGTDALRFKVNRDMLKIR